MRRRTNWKLLALLLALLMALAACGGDETEETPEATEAAGETEADPTEAATEPETEPEVSAEGVSCAEPVKIGLITDETGSLGIYGAHVLRSFPLGLEYATGSSPTEGDGYTSYML
ncbi:MAG: hypothetical protein KDE34_22475, partial [Anaerolineales bacterium]|nr:hypothetical protein [Anaerolineales bacterium]